MASQLLFFFSLCACQSRCGIAFPLLLNGWKRRERQIVGQKVGFSEYKMWSELAKCWFDESLLTGWKMHQGLTEKTEGTLTLFGGQRVFLFCLRLLQLCLVKTSDLRHVGLVRHFGCKRCERKQLVSRMSSTNEKWKHQVLILKKSWCLSFETRDRGRGCYMCGTHVATSHTRAILLYSFSMSLTWQCLFLPNCLFGPLSLLFPLRSCSLCSLLHPPPGTALHCSHLFWPTSPQVGLICLSQSGPVMSAWTAALSETWSHLCHKPETKQLHTEGKRCNGLFSVPWNQKNVFCSATDVYHCRALEWTAVIRSTSYSVHQ